MATTWAMLIEGTRDLSEFGAAGAGNSVDTSVFHCGLASLKHDTGSPAANVTSRIDGVLADAGSRATYWYRFEAAPSGSAGILFALDASNAAVWQLQLLTTRILRFAPGGGTTVDGSTVLATGTWHRITVAQVITSTTVQEVRVYVNGVLEITASNTGTWTRVGTSRLRLQSSLTLGTNWVSYFDDVVIDNGTDLADPGDLRCTAKRPNANGSANTFDTTTGAGSGYGTGNSVYVNERPLATGSNRTHAADGSTADENFNIEAVTAGDRDLNGFPLVARVAWAHGSGVSTDELYDDGASAVPATAFSSTAGIRTKIVDATSYPSNPAAGMKRATASATDAVLNECGVILVYRVPAEQSFTGAMTPAGALVRQPSTLLAGSAASAGALLRQTVTLYAGSLVSAGALIRQPAKLVAGTMTSAGALIRQANVLLAGTLGSAGALVRVAVPPVFSGTLTSAGALIRQPAKLVSGSIASSGAVIYQVTKLVAGSVASSGALVREARTLYAGSLASSGALVRTVLLAAFSGSLASAGVLLRVPVKLTSGAMSSAGALVRVVVPPVFAGTVTSAGALVRQPVKLLAGTVASSGALVRQVSVLLAGTLSFSGAVVRVVNAVLSGAISLAGALIALLPARPARTFTAPTRSLILVAPTRSLTLVAPTRSLSLRVTANRRSVSLAAPTRSLTITARVA